MEAHELFSHLHSLDLHIKQDYISHLRLKNGLWDWNGVFLGKIQHQQLASIFEVEILAIREAYQRMWYGSIDS